MFFYINVRIFKVKLNNYINFAINSLTSIKFKKIKIFYKLLNFEYFFLKFLLYIILVYTIFIFF